jgi:hypothetical protein
MKKLSDMNLQEVEAAYDMALRHRPVDTHAVIEADPTPKEGDDPQLAYCKAAYRRVRQLHRSSLERFECGAAPPVYASLS